MTVYVIFERQTNKIFLGSESLIIFQTELEAQEWVNGDPYFVIKEMKLEEIK